MPHTTEVVKARMKNPAMILPDAFKALQALKASAEKSGVPARTIGLVELRASQINGCSVCVDMHSRDLKKAGETDDRLFAVAAWRDAPYFTEDERAALALAEAVTRISAIANINVWNRLNVATRQVAGEWAKSTGARASLEKDSNGR